MATKIPEHNPDTLTSWDVSVEAIKPLKGEPTNPTLESPEPECILLPGLDDGQRKIMLPNWRDIEGPEPAPTQATFDAIIGKGYYPDPKIFNKVDSSAAEIWNLTYPRYFQYRATLEERIWLNALTQSMRMPASTYDKDPRFMLGLKYVLIFGYGSATTNAAVIGYRPNLEGIKKYVRNYAKTPPTTQELTYNPSTFESASSMKAHRRAMHGVQTKAATENAQAMMKNPELVKKMFMADVLKEEDQPFRGCWIWNGKVHTKPGITRESRTQHFPIGKFYLPYPQQKARRFAWVAIAGKDLNAHQRLYQYLTCHPDCVNPDHMEAS